jgi:uncharacterized iron-regulated membrane protein
MASITYRALWRWHFHAGILCIPFVLVLALTGSIYLFKLQIDAFADRGVDSLEIHGRRASGEAQIAAAIASLPGSKLFTYEVPLEPNDAVRVHLYATDGAGRIVYVHPETLAVLKTVPHTHRLTEFVKTIHFNLFAGRTGSILIELAASWAIVMLGTGLYLWWPRDRQGLKGVLYPRLGSGRRVFWRDLHAVVGVWISSLAMFLLITALPWTTVWGAGFTEMRAFAASRETQDWPSGGGGEHPEHQPAITSASVASPVALDEVVARIAQLGLDPPVRIYLPAEHQPFWRVQNETQNRTRVRELDLDANTGEVLSERGFAGKPLVDRVVGIGISAHEGQLFGLANQLLGLTTALGLITMCVSAIVMWWRRRPDGALGVPAPRVREFRITPALGVLIVALGVLLPVLGASLLLLALIDWVRPRTAGIEA